MSTAIARSHRQLRASGTLATGVPRRGGDAERLGGQLQVVTGLAGGRRQGEHLVGAGERVLLARTDVAQTAGGQGDGLVAVATEELRPGDGGLDAPADRGIGVLGECGGPIDVVDHLSRRPSGRRRWPAGAAGPVRCR